MIEAVVGLALLVALGTSIYCLLEDVHITGELNRLHAVGDRERRPQHRFHPRGELRRQPLRSPAQDWLARIHRRQAHQTQFIRRLREQGIHEQVDRPADVVDADGVLRPPRRLG